MFEEQRPAAICDQYGIAARAVLHQIATAAVRTFVAQVAAQVGAAPAPAWQQRQ